MIKVREARVQAGHDAEATQGKNETDMSARSNKQVLKKSDLRAVATRPDALAAEIRQMIESARQQVAHAINAGLTFLYWRIGCRIHREVLRGKRAEYGAEIVSALGRQLSAEFGRGFDEKSLRHMLRFAEAFPEESIVSALRRQLAWTHFKQILPRSRSARGRAPRCYRSVELVAAPSGPAGSCAFRRPRATAVARSWAAPFRMFATIGA